MAVKIIRSKKSFATLSNARSFAPLHKRGKGSQADDVRTLNEKLRKDRENRMESNT